MNSHLHADNESQDSIDLAKLRFILLKSVWWILIFFVIGISSAYLVVRYTKPLYEAHSIIKLNFKNEASSLGLVNPQQPLVNIDDLSGEIELLMSDLFLGKVIDQLDYNVSYYYYGRYLVDERYGNSPFEVSYKVKNPRLYNLQIDLDIIDSDQFELSYPYNGEKVVVMSSFGNPIENDHLNLLVEKTSAFNSSVFGRYFFRIHSKQRLIQYFKNNLSIRPENLRAKTIRISLADFNRAKATDFVDVLSNLYLTYTSETKNQALEQKIEFLNQQMKITEEKVEELEDYFENFIIENKTVSLEQDLSRTIGHLYELDSQAFRIRNEISNVQSLSEQLENGEVLLLNPYFISQLPTFISTAIDEYQEVFKERSAKIESYNENTSVVRRLDNQLEQVRTNLLELITEYDSNLNKTLQDIQGRRLKLEGSFTELPSLGTEHTKNQRLYALQESFLTSLRQSRMELEITRAGTVAESVILAPANASDQPIKPQQLMIFGVGVVASMVFSIFFVLIRYLLHNKITSTRELERLTHIPILGSIPHYRKEKLVRTRLVVDPGSKSSISEAFRTIRTNMDFMRPAKETKLIAITSTISGEGKTFVTVNLGAILAAANKRICVVDLDMRKPKVHRALGHDPAPKGVSTILSGKSNVGDSFLETEVPNLFFIAAGPTPPNPSELIMSNEFDELLVKLKKEFDLIILDTPPIGLVTDGVLAMKKADQQVYVLRSEYSRRVFARTILDVQRINRFDNMSLLLNGVRSRGSGHGDGAYGYGDGYGYYDDAVKKKRFSV